MVEYVGAMHKAGVPIVAGTDGNGIELVRELELYVEGGMTPAEALATATIDAARNVKARQAHRIDRGRQGSRHAAGRRRLRDEHRRPAPGRSRWCMDGEVMDGDALAQGGGIQRPAEIRGRHNGGTVMRAWGKMLIAAVAPLMLSGCLWGPGKFSVEAGAQRKGGTFVLDYRGEIILQMPDDKAARRPSRGTTTWRAATRTAAPKRCSAIASRSFATEA